jgi:hypothetical protein
MGFDIKDGNDTRRMLGRSLSTGRFRSWSANPNDRTAKNGPNRRTPSTTASLLRVSRANERHAARTIGATFRMASLRRRLVIDSNVTSESERYLQRTRSTRTTRLQLPGVLPRRRLREEALEELLLRGQVPRITATLVTIVDTEKRVAFFAQ